VVVIDIENLTTTLMGLQNSSLYFTPPWQNQFRSKWNNYSTSYFWLYNYFSSV